MVADPAIDLRMLVRRGKWVERGSVVLCGGEVGACEK